MEICIKELHLKIWFMDTIQTFHFVWIALLNNNILTLTILSTLSKMIILKILNA